MKATNRFGHPIPCIDEGFSDSPIFLVCESLGPVAIIRAPTWHEAYEVAEDLVFSDADPEDPDNYASSYDPTAEPGDLAEGVGYRPNGVPPDPDRWPEDNPFKLRSHLYQEDLNGSRIRRVSVETLVLEYGIHLFPPEE